MCALAGERVCVNTNVSPSFSTRRAWEQTPHSNARARAHVLLSIYRSPQKGARLGEMADSRAGAGEERDGLNAGCRRSQPEGAPTGRLWSDIPAR